MEIDFDFLPAQDLSLFSVLGMKLRQRPDTIIRYDIHGREDHMLHYALSGERCYWSGGKEMQVHPGDVLFLPMGLSYTTRVEGDKDAFGYNVRFLLRNDAGEAVAVRGGLQCLMQDRGEELLPFFQRIASLSIRSSMPLAAKACLAELLCKTVRMRLSPKSGDWLNLTLSYMGRNLNQPLAIADLAEHCHMSVRTFCRKFKEATGKSPAAYHRAMRVNRAREFLESGTFTLEATAEALGFTDAAHLSRCFYRETGIRAGELRRASAPTILRKKNRPVP